MYYVTNYTSVLKPSSTSLAGLPPVERVRGMLRRDKTGVYRPEKMYRRTPATPGKTGLEKISRAFEIPFYG
jgi:hypothetical protein